MHRSSSREEEFLDLLEVSFAGFTEYTQAKRLSAGRFWAVEHRVSASDVNPRCVGLRIATAPSLDESRIRGGFRSFELNGQSVIGDQRPVLRG